MSRSRRDPGDIRVPADRHPARECPRCRRLIVEHYHPGHFESCQGRVHEPEATWIAERRDDVRADFDAEQGAEQIHHEALT